MAYVPHTPEDIRAMLEVVGVADIDALFAHLPSDVRLDRPLDLPDGISEEEVRRYFGGAAGRNHGTGELVSFLGGGVYDAVIPAACDAVVSRSEFLTAYTPYQPEVSQGTLQAIYEWQTFVCRLTGLDVANASMYDGATALSEAASVAIGAKRKKKIVVPAALNPRYRRVLETTLRGEGVEIVEAPSGHAGTTDPAGLAALVDGTVAGVVIQNPNHLGLLEPVEELAAAATAGGAIVVACVNPVSLAVAKSPAEYGAELAVGEAQPFGINQGWGGPLLGFMACADKHKRRIPGRVVGRTEDTRGNAGYVLTLQTREQHIRREKATSNICSNQGLNALRATVYLAMLGAGGLAELGEANLTRLGALRRAVAGIDGVELPYPGPAFNETVLRLPRPAADFRRFARAHGVLAGISLDGVADCGPNDLLAAVTEKRTDAEIDTYADLLTRFAAGEEAGRE
ncbi:MAG: aminomethyl-transferring glycine dehydrogenase subunit GcvPA [bacterium]|nr:aminomethyl-transferring glycine dehydrogenase subunit GcvPA [bacterium]